MEDSLRRCYSLTFCEFLHDINISDADRRSCFRPAPVSGFKSTCLLEFSSHCQLGTSAIPVVGKLIIRRSPALSNMYDGSGTGSEKEVVYPRLLGSQGEVPTQLSAP